MKTNHLHWLLTHPLCGFSLKNGITVNLHYDAYPKLPTPLDVDLV